MKKRTSKLLSILLTLTMLLGLLPAMGTTALAAERETPDAGNLSIDGGVHFAEPSNLYYSTSTKDFVGFDDAWTAHYDPTSGVLTLKDYHGGPISLGSAKSLALTIDLQGTNEITESSTATNSNVVIAGISVTSGRGGDLSITSSTGGTLAISVSGTGPQVFGIVSDFGTLAGSGDVTISGNASVSIATSSNIQGDTKVYNCCAGISAYKVSILDSASLSTVQKSNCTLLDSQRQTGVFARSGVTINTTGTVSIDASQATKDTDGNFIYSYGFCGSDVQLTNVGELTVKECCRTQKVTYNEAQYAYNEAHSTGVYTKNWRPGTAHTLTVVNGSNSFGNSVGQYLAGDEVSITARSIEGVQFKSWSADSGSITGSGSAAATFTMPDGDATVTASFTPVSALTYTRISSTNGSISYTPVNESLVQSRRLIKNGGDPENSADVISYFYSSGDPFTAAAAPEGEYQIALRVGSVWHVSEPVYVWYDGFSAQPSFSGAAGSAGTLTFAVNSRLGSPTVSLVKTGGKTEVEPTVSSGSSYTLDQGSYQLMFTVGETTYYSDSFKVLPAADGVFAVQPVFTGTTPSEGTITYTLADLSNVTSQRLIKNGGNPENSEDIINYFLYGSYDCYKESLTDGWYQVAVKIDSTWFKSQPFAVLYSPFGTWDSSSTSYTVGLPAFDPASGAVTYTWNAEVKDAFGAPEAYGLARITYAGSVPSYSLVYDSLASGTELTEAMASNGYYCMAARYDGKWYYSPRMEIITNAFVGVPSAEWQEDGSVKITYELDSMVSSANNKYLFKASDMSNTGIFVYSGSAVSQGALNSVDTYVIGIQYDGNWYYSQPFTVDFRQPPYFASTDNVFYGKAGTAGVLRENGDSFTGFNIGGDATNRKVFVSGGSLPAGLTLNSDGTFSGTPSECGKFTFSVTAQNESGSATLDCILRVMGQPSFYPKDGTTFTDTLYLFVGCDLAGAAVECKVNNGYFEAVYGGMIELTDTSTVQIRATMEGYLQSDTIEATYTKVDKPEAPTANGKTDGSYTFVGSTTVTLASSTTSTTISYTTDGSDPTYSPTAEVYSTPILLTDTTTIKAVAAIGTAYSDVATFTFTPTTGYSVSGKVASYNGKNDFTVTLYETGTTTEKGKVTVTGTGASGQATQDFTLTGVASGTYDLVVTKAGHLTYTITGVVVGAGNVDLTADTSKVYSTITLLAGNMDGNNAINLQDLNQFRSNFGKAGSSITNSNADIDGNATVNLQDLNVFRSNFGKTTTDCTKPYTE